MSRKKVYVDETKSTEKSLHCYYYGLYVFDDLFDDAPKDGKSPVLTISYADKPMVSLTDTDPIQEKSVTIPVKDALNTFSFSSEAGGFLELSPISLKVDMSKGLGLTKDEASNPIHLEKISIQFKDGSDYQVYDQKGNVDNTAYLCGGLETDIFLAFNRLIDPSEISTVTVNDVVFKVDAR